MPPATPDGLQHREALPHEPLRTFHPRRAALGARRRDALDRLWPRWGFSVHDEAVGLGPRSSDGLLDLPALFGRPAPVVLEIGPGMGEATAQAAAADPDRDVLAVDVHVPGVANLLGLLEQEGVTNVRVGHGDALELARTALAPGCLDEVRAWFPDPWPKARHHKRRLVQPAHVALLRGRLRVGGTFHLATDRADYAEQALVVLQADEGLAGGVVPRPATRPVSGYERRGLAAGRASVDLIFRRIA